MFSKSVEPCCGPVKACVCCASLSLPCFHIRADKALLNLAMETANQNNREVTDSLVIFQFQKLVFLYGRLVNLVVRLREWAHRSLLEEEERPDSFMERFRGPELRLAPSRISNTQPDANGNNAKGFFRYACLMNQHYAL